MYRRILIAVENSGADRTIVDHVSQLARLTGAELLLVHVADGWAARNFDQLQLRESEEMQADRAYLDKLSADLITRGFIVQTKLATRQIHLHPQTSLGCPERKETCLVSSTRT